MRDEHVGESAIAAHDRQRQLPAQAQRALISGLYSHLHDRGRCLDVGVGTGSVAIPLARAGIAMVGVDISRAMLDALRANRAGTAPFPVVRGNLTQLPFRDGAFGSALAANVFHLIPAWRSAVVELVRVVEPGGILLVNFGSGGAATERSRRVTAKFREILRDQWPSDTHLPGPRDTAEFESFVQDRGGKTLSPLEIQFDETTTIEAVIARLEHNPFARPATIDQATLHRAASATRAWAHQRFGPLDATQSTRRVITYRIYKLPL